ncbi:kinase-like domain-containing protein [Ilyonectria destructans]|nr:kinase-like domain-containing protein [Ilyonectria destructans]
MQLHATVSLNSLPSGSLVTFEQSSFFSRNGPDTALPSPSEVLAKSATEDPYFKEHINHPPVLFEPLGLVVKFGKDPKVTIAEGQCLWSLHQLLPQVLVPEIYGWRQDGDNTFLYMELVQGVTLENQWDSLNRTERGGVCENLRDILTELRQLRQDPSDLFLGHINRNPYSDVVFTNGVLPRAGPFRSVKEFHDWLSAMIRRGKESHWPGLAPEDIPDPYRQLLPDAAVVFTHADLHPSNIIVSSEPPYRVTALIDWEQSGWYPDYWEFCKAEYTVNTRSEWATEYLPKFLKEPSDSCLDGFATFSKAYGF